MAELSALRVEAVTTMERLSDYCDALFADDTVAARYGLMHGRRFYSYIGGFDPRHEHLSPGSLLIGHAIEQAIAEGATEFDFLRGRESYKYLWGVEDRVVYRRALQPPPASLRRRVRNIQAEFAPKDNHVRLF